MVQVFGTRNASEPFLLSKLNPKRLSKKKIRGDQNVKVIETQIDLGSDMGVIYLLRFSCKQWNPDLIKVIFFNTPKYFWPSILRTNMESFCPGNASISHWDLGVFLSWIVSSCISQNKVIKVLPVINKMYHTRQLCNNILVLRINIYKNHWEAPFSFSLLFSPFL